MTVLRAGSATDVGQVRNVNQDTVFASATVFAVADGMGGHAGGEVASSSAVDILERSLGSLGTQEGLIEALQMANESIVEASVNDPSLAGMGTTMVVASLMATDHGDVLTVGNVGDSRGYLFRKGNLSQITADHSISAELVREGSISEKEAKHHPQRHVITRALGISDPVKVDIFELVLADGDRILLCSDGLSNEVSGEEIVRVLSTLSDPTEASLDLVQRANANGGADNISVVIIDALVTDTHDDEPTQSHNVVPLIAPLPPIVEPEPAITPEPALEPKKREGWFARRRRLGAPRTITFRVIFFLVLIGLVVYGSWYFVRWYATSSYYVTTNGTQIVIYRGRPGGVLWFTPSVAEVTTTTTAEVLPIRLPALHGDVIEPSLSEAKNYVANLNQEYRQTITTTPTTTPASSLAAPLSQLNLAV